MMQSLFRLIGCKTSAGGFLSPPSNLRAQPWLDGGNYQARVHKGREDFQWSSEMRRDRKEYQRRKHFCWGNTDIER